MTQKIYDRAFTLGLAKVADNEGRAVDRKRIGHMYYWLFKNRFTIGPKARFVTYRESRNKNADIIQCRQKRGESGD